MDLPSKNWKLSPWISGVYWIILPKLGRPVINIATEWEWQLTSKNRKPLPKTGETLYLSGFEFHFLENVFLPIFMNKFPMFSLYNFQYLVAISKFMKAVSNYRKSMITLILILLLWLAFLILEPLFSRLRKSTDFSSDFWKNGIIFVSVYERYSRKTQGWNENGLFK